MRFLNIYGKLLQKELAKRDVFLDQRAAEDFARLALYVLVKSLTEADVPSVLLRGIATIKRVSSPEGVVRYTIHPHSKLFYDKNIPIVCYSGTLKLLSPIIKEMSMGISNEQIDAMLEDIQTLKKKES